MKQDMSTKAKVENGVYTGLTIFMFVFSLIILACVLLTIGGTALQIVF